MHALSEAATKSVVATALLGVAFACDAAGGLILLDVPPKQDYTLAIGPAVDGQPESPGSGRTKLTPIPGVDFYSSYGVFASTDLGLGWNVSHRDDLQLGARLWPIFGRGDKRSRERGLRDIGSRLGKGLFLDYEPVEFVILQTSALAGSAYRGDGLQLEAGATIGTRLGEAALLGLTLGATWANGPHLRTYYGVGTEESIAGALPLYLPHAGWEDVNLALNGELRLGARWKLTGQVLAARLVGEARHSPVTTSPWQSTFSLTFWYELR